MVPPVIVAITIDDKHARLAACNARNVVDSVVGSLNYSNFCLASRAIFEVYVPIIKWKKNPLKGYN